MGQGAIPIIRNGEVTGACGIGGGTPKRRRGVCSKRNIRFAINYDPQKTIFYDLMKGH